MLPKAHQQSRLEHWIGHCQRRTAGNFHKSSQIYFSRIKYNLLDIVDHRPSSFEFATNKNPVLQTMPRTSQTMPRTSQSKEAQRHAAWRRFKKRKQKRDKVSESSLVSTSEVACSFSWYFMISSVKTLDRSTRRYGFTKLWTVIHIPCAHYVTLIERVILFDGSSHFTGCLTDTS